MKTLIIDTSTQALIVSFVDNEKVILKEIHIGKNNHSDNLLKTIEEGLKKLNIEVNDFNNVIVGIGPGAYTGLRVSLTVAKMFCWTLNKTLYTVSSLDLLASGYFKQDGIYPIMMKAKKGFVYGKVLKVENNKIEEIVEEQYLSVEEYTALINNYKYDLIVNEENINFDPLLLKENLLTKVEDITFLEPNYLRGVM